jgi:oligoendopeptidase F
MEDEAEALTSELNVNGINAWSRLYDTLSGQLKFTYVDADGETRTAPMGQRFSLVSGNNRSVRASAFEGSNAAWAQHEVTCNAALNSLAGTRHTLDKHRGSDHFLAEACIEARLAACRACKWRIRMIVQKVRRFRVQLEHFDHCSPLNGKFLL